MPRAPCSNYEGSISGLWRQPHVTYNRDLLNSANPARITGVPNMGMAFRTRMRHWKLGGDKRLRTDDLLLARQALSQLSYVPINDRSEFFLVGDLPLLGSP